MLFLLQVKELMIGKGRPKICVPIMGDTQEKLLAQALKASQSVADIVEWRVDYFETVSSLETVLSNSN